MRAILVAITLLSTLGNAAPQQAPQASIEQKTFRQLPKPGRHVMLDADTYFIYGFTTHPKLGTVIMRVEIFRRDGQRDTSYTVKGDVDMPSMRGAHTMGERPFVLSAKGHYLRPVPLVMPGDWEFRFAFEKAGKPTFRGAYLFSL